SHPVNHEREERAKRNYRPSDENGASAWALFRVPEALRREMCLEMVKDCKPPLPVATREETLAALEAEYARESFKRIYRGCYLARPLTRAQARPEDLYLADVDLARSRETYTPAVAATLKELASLGKERDQLHALQEGVAQAGGDGAIRFRGRELAR